MRLYEIIMLPNQIPSCSTKGSTSAFNLTEFHKDTTTQFLIFLLFTIIFALQVKRWIREFGFPPMGFP